MLQSRQANRKQRAGTGSEANPRTRANPQALGKEESRRSAPFSPVGRHGALRGLLLSVGNVLARDESGSLSRVSLNELKKGLSDFLSASRLDENEFLGVGTSRSAAAASTRRGVTGDVDEKARVKRQALARMRDEAIIARLKAHNDGI